MLVIYPFSTRDEKQALKNAHWIAELGEYKSHDVFILADRRCEVPLAQKINDLFTPLFRVVQFRWTISDIDGWPQGANQMFSYAATLIQHTKEWPYFLWLEPDAIPIRKGWLDELETEYKNGRKPFMGEKVDLGTARPDVPVHMSGIGFYQNPIYLLAGECYRAHEVAWDIAAKDQILPNAYFTTKIQHYWKHGTFTSLDGLRPETLIFHSSKDGSLIDMLRGGAEAARMAHNHEAVGSIPTPATTSATPPCLSTDGATGQPATRDAHIKILPHNGIWVLEGDTIISDMVEREGRLDFDTLIPYVIEHIRPGDTVVDVGAFIGDHTVAYSHAVGKAGKVIAYEPHQLAFQCLVHNTEKCGNVFTFCHALGNESGIVTITDLTNAASNYVDSAGVRTVNVRPLDEDASLFGQIDLIKIDVEGYELNVLKGAEKLIEKFHPKMVIEINEIALARQYTVSGEISDWLAAHGYTYSILHRHKDAPFYDILAVANQPPEILQDAIAHTPESSPVAPRSVSEVVKDLVGQLKEIAETFPQGRSIVSARLVLSGLRPPNKKHEHRKTSKTTNGKRGSASKERKT